MAVDTIYLITFINGERPDARAVLNAGLTLGLTATGDDRSEVAPRYTVDGAPGTYSGKSGADLDAICSEIDDADEAGVDLWYDNAPSCKVTIELETPGDEEIAVPVSLDVQTLPLDPAADDRTRRTVQQRVETIVRLLAELVTSARPEYACGMLLNERHPSEGIVPPERPVADTIEEFSWVTVLSPDVIDDLGGRAHVRDTPAWRIEALDTGHLLLLKSDNPVRPTESPDPLPRAHLLGE